MLNSKANIKRSHNIWFHLYNILEINDRDGKCIIGFQELGIVGEGGGECDYKGAVWGRSFGDWIILHIDCGSGYTHLPTW